MNFKQFLDEAVNDRGKNLHMEHLEDLLFLDGIKGARNSILFLRALRDMLDGETADHINITTKWDGAPAIICGLNPENKQFFVATKSAFNKNPKLNYTEEDIDNNHSGGLASKLKIALRYLPLLGIKTVIQGDLLYTKHDLKHQNIHGEKCVTFQPNTIVYAIPENSDLADQIESSELGIVFHTTYVGKTMQNLRASYGVDIGNFKRIKQVWFRDATFRDESGTATFTEEETEELDNILSDLGYQFQRLNPGLISRIAENDTLRLYVSTFNNQKVREGQEISNISKHTHDLFQSVLMKLNRDIVDAKKDDTRRNREQIKKEVMSFFGNRNYNDFVAMFEFHNLVVKAKNMIIRKLERVKDLGTFIRTASGFRVTAPEGFVAIDHEGKAVKLVDRLTFSHNNFNVAKDWDR